MTGLFPNDNLGKGGFLVSSEVGVLTIVVEAWGRLCWTVILLFSAVEPPPPPLLLFWWWLPLLLLLWGKSAAKLFIISNEAMRSASFDVDLNKGLIVGCFTGEWIFKTCFDWEDLEGGPKWKGSNIIIESRILDNPLFLKFWFHKIFIFTAQ